MDGTIWHWLKTESVYKASKVWHIKSWKAQNLGEERLDPK